MKRIIYILLLLPLLAQAQTGVHQPNGYFFTGPFAIGKGLQGYNNATQAQSHSEMYPPASAWLEIGKDSTNRGMLIPRVLRRDSVQSPTRGNMVYEIVSGLFLGYDGSAWDTLSGAGSTSASGPDSTAAGLWLSESSNTINADSAAMAAYFVRRKDSTVTFVTPTQMNSQGYLTSAPVTSVNGQTGAASLGLDDVILVDGSTDYSIGMRMLILNNSGNPYYARVRGSHISGSVKDIEYQNASGDVALKTNTVTGGDTTYSPTGDAVSTYVASALSSYVPAIPTWDQVLTAGNSSTHDAITTGYVRASTLQIQGGAAKTTLKTAAASSDKDLWCPNVTDTIVTRDAFQTLTNKTLTAPTIASFTNAQHNHTNAAGGGLLTASAMPKNVIMAACAVTVNCKANGTTPLFTTSASNGYFIITAVRGITTASTSPSGNATINIGWTAAIYNDWGSSSVFVANAVGKQSYTCNGQTAIPPNTTVYANVVGTTASTVYDIVIFVEGYYQTP